MINKVFSVYDSKAEAFMAPFCMSTKGQATRAFTDLASDSKSNVAKHPMDFALFMLGEFDDATGQFKNLLAPESLGLATEYNTPDMPFAAGGK